VPRGVDHDFLALERRVEVGDYPDPPTRSVGRATLGRQREDLGRGPVLAALAERAALELLGGLGLDLADACARATSACRSEGDEAP